MGLFHIKRSDPMDFPDSHVKKIVNGLRKESSSGKTFDLSTEIENLTLFQRFQLFCLVQKLKISDPELFPLEIKIWETIHALFRNDYTETLFLIENYDNSEGISSISNWPSPSE